MTFARPVAAPWLAVTLLAAAGTAHAAPAKPAPSAVELDAALVRQDQNIQKLKDEALSANRELLTLDEQLLYPDISRVSVFVAVKVGGFLLNEVVVKLDDGQEVRHRYTDSESKALLRNGMHRVMRANVNPGAHRLRAEFSGRFIDAKPDEPPVTGSAETIFDKALEPIELVLPVTRNSRLDRPGLPEVARMESTQTRPARRALMLNSSRSARSRDYAPGSSQDPYLGMAVFLKNDQRYFTAISELLRIAARVPDPAQLPFEFHEQLAECYLAFGVPSRAEAIFQRLAGETKRDALTLARAKLRLAELYLDRGYYEKATQTLQGITEKLPEELLPDWQDALARSLLAQERYAEAIEILTESDKVDRLPAHARYNLAIAMLKDGRVEQGRNLLDRVGIMKVPDKEALALRDRANLTLGYHFLRAQLGGTAKPVFGRVRTDGPYANRALLGLGWAELAPRGRRQDRQFVPGDPQDQSPFSTFSSLGVLLRRGYYDTDPFGRLGLRPFRLDKISKDEQEALKRALVPWTVLAERDPMDPAVQEGLLAIPFALDRLKAHEEAAQLYQRAIGTLEEGRRRMDVAMKSIGEGRMVETIVRRDLDAESGWMWRLRDLPDAAETYYLQTLLAEDRFQESLKNYRDLRLLTRSLDSWKDRLANHSRGAPGLQAPQLSPDLYVARARSGAEPYVIVNAIPLRFEQRMTTPGVYTAPAPQLQYAGLVLKGMPAPARPNGAYERMAVLTAQMEQLRPRLAAGAGEESRRLHSVAVKELTGQKRQIERYIVEARLAMARLYDRTRAEDLPATTPTAPAGARP